MYVAAFVGKGEIKVTNYWEGKRVRLRSVEPGDARFHHEFHTSMEHDLLDQRFPPVSLSRVDEWAQRKGQQGFDDQTFCFQVVEVESGELVGGIATHHCDQRIGVLSYGLHTFPEHRGKGYAKEAICLVLRFYFQELRYQKANVAVYDINAPSKALHVRLGFTEEGRQRRTVYTRGEWWDLVWFGMTVEEFRDLHGDYWMSPPSPGVTGCR